MDYNKFGTVIKNGEFLKSISSEIHDKLHYKTQDDPSIDINEVCEFFDQRIKKKGYILWPTSVEINQFVSDYSPAFKQEIGLNDKVSFTLSIDGHKKDKERYPIKCAYTFPAFGERYLSLIKTVDEACQAGINKSGPDVSLIEVRDVISEVLESFSMEDSGGSNKVIEGIKTIKGTFGHSLSDNNKIIPSTQEISYDDVKRSSGRMEPNEMYYINVYGTNLAEHEPSYLFDPFPTMFSNTSFDGKHRRKELVKAIEMLKKVGRKPKELYDFCYSTYGTTKVYSLRDLMSKYKKTYNSDLKLIEMRPVSQCGLITGIPTMLIEHDLPKKMKRMGELSELRKKTTDEIELEKINKEAKELKKNNSIAVHFGHSIYVTDSGSEIIC